MKFRIISHSLILAAMLIPTRGLQAAAWFAQVKALVSTSMQWIIPLKLPINRIEGARTLSSQAPADKIMSSADSLKLENTNSFVEEVTAQPSGSPLTKRAKKGLFDWKSLDWLSFSMAPVDKEHQPENVRCLAKVLASLHAHPTQLEALPYVSILNMLSNAPIEQYESWIVLYLQHLNYEEPGSTIAQLIADIIILFDLSIDVRDIATNKQFAARIMEAKDWLQESYTYHKHHPVTDRKSPLRSWIHEELGDERNRLIEEIKHQFDTEPIFDELHKHAMRQALKQKEHVTIWQRNDKPEKYGILEYTRRKLLALGYNFTLPIEIYDDKFGFAAMKVGYPGGDKALVVSPDLFSCCDALGLNSILAHEMTHYYQDHTGFHLDLRIKAGRIPLTLKRWDAAEFVCGIVHEKEADILAGLHTGPRASIFYGEFSDRFTSKRTDGIHAPGPTRNAALQDLAQLIASEEIGRPFVQPRVEESPFARWLGAKCEHPEEA